MSVWQFCDDLDAPEFATCMSQSYWQEHFMEILNWLNEQDAGSMFGDRVVFVYKDKRALFMLRFGP